MDTGKEVDYYKVLGIDRKSSKDEIKKAYRKLALKYHPDKNRGNSAAEDTFKTVNMAYEVLSDDSKRQRYDQRGSQSIHTTHSGFQSTYNFGGNGGTGFNNMPDFDPFATFNNFFSSNPSSQYRMDTDDIDWGDSFFSNNSSFKGLSRNAKANKAKLQKKQEVTGVTKTIEHEVNVTLEELLVGCTKRYKISRDRIRDGKLYREDKLFDIAVKPGWKDGTKIRYEKEANDEPGKLTGDIVFIIKTKTHLRYERDGPDLIYKQQVSLGQALSGQSMAFDIPLLDKLQTKLRVQNEIISPQTKQVLAGQGLPCPKNPSRRGNLIVMFDIRFPEKLDSATQKASQYLL